MCGGVHIKPVNHVGRDSSCRRCTLLAQKSTKVNPTRMRVFYTKRPRTKTNQWDKKTLRFEHVVEMYVFLFDTLFRVRNKQHNHESVNTMRKKQKYALKRSIDRGTITKSGQTGDFIVCAQNSNLWANLNDNMEDIMHDVFFTFLYFLVIGTDAKDERVFGGSGWHQATNKKKRLPSASLAKSASNNLSRLSSASSAAANSASGF